MPGGDHATGSPGEARRHSPRSARGHARAERPDVPGRSRSKRESHRGVTPRAYAHGRCRPIRGTVRKHPPAAPAAWRRRQSRPGHPCHRGEAHGEIRLTGGAPARAQGAAVLGAVCGDGHRAAASRRPQPPPIAVSQPVAARHLMPPGTGPGARRASIGNLDGCFRKVEARVFCAGQSWCTGHARAGARPRWCEEARRARRYRAVLARPMLMHRRAHRLVSPRIGRWRARAVCPTAD